MKLDKLNQWLSLLANVGVIVGLVFLIAEMPGVIPAWEYRFEGYELDDNSEPETMAYLVTAVRKYKQERATQFQSDTP